MTLAFPRRRLLALGAVALGGAAVGAPTRRLVMNGGPDTRALSTAFPGKGEMIVQRIRPPLLETPFEVFDQGVFTPNDRFFVRWHWDAPTSVDSAAFRLRIDGAVERPFELTLDEILRLPRTGLAAVNQCAGNSRALFEPRMPGAQWSHGAMGNARWEGVSLKALLDRARMKAGAVAVRLSGLDTPLTDADRYAKSLPIDVARSDLPFLAYAMNGEVLPMLNGFPLRLVVPGWYSTYWVKAVNRIEVLDAADTNFWTAKAYKIPTTPGADIAPGAKDFPTVPISTMVPRSFITNVREGESIAAGPTTLRGIAMGGDHGVARVDVSPDGGRTWRPATLGTDEGRYSFRQFTAGVTLARGPVTLMARCTNAAGVTQPMRANWNPSGYMRGCVETVNATVA